MPSGKPYVYAWDSRFLSLDATATHRWKFAQCFHYAFKSLKPADAVIMSMFPKFSDQFTENAAIFRALVP